VVDVIGAAGLLVTLGAICAMLATATVVRRQVH
jgi:proteasome assembly chaperone (PAC2) family protein